MLCHTFIEGQTFYSTLVQTDTILINLDNHYKISSVNIIHGSERIKLRGEFLSDKDYKFDYSNNTFFINPNVPYSIFDTLFVTYQSVFLSLKKSYKKRELIIQFTEDKLDSAYLVSTSTSFLSNDDIFGKSIQKSGTLIRGFTIGTNKDLTLQSGLRLQISGKLSDDIEIVAALTDENSPIQPEGNTERLSELDKVFIQIKHQNAVGTFGDYDLIKRNGEFGVINRRLQGLFAEVKFDNIDGYFGIASAKGKFNSQKFNGTDGVQGPYRLSGANGERNIIVIAGSEKVFIDGEEVQRGERNDYTIDYAIAEITFTTNRLITSASRISIDFEYTDRNYSRTTMGAGGNVFLFNDKLTIGLSLFSDGDEKSSPIDISLSDEDKEILKNAGDDRMKAVKSGVSLAVEDSTGVIRGVYARIDTTIDNNSYVFYKYSPGSVDAIYNVTFSFVGNGKGDYVRKNAGEFDFVGINKGSYAPIIFLPLPELKQFSNLNLNYNFYRNFYINIEFALSKYDKNKFSNIDKEDDNGFARNVVLKLEQTPILINENNYGQIGFSLRERFIESKFTSLDRFNSVEFDRDFNTSGSPNKDELLREAAINYKPINSMSLLNTYSFLSKGDDFNSKRNNTLLQIKEKEDYELSFNNDYVSTKNFMLGGEFHRIKSKGFYSFYILKTGFDFNLENKRDFYTKNDSLLLSSFKNYEISPFVEMSVLSNLKFIYNYIFRKDFVPQNGIMEDESKSKGHSVDIFYNLDREFITSLKLIVRDKIYSDKFISTTSLNNQTILVRSQTKTNLFDNFWSSDLFYEVSTQRTAKLQKVFVQVQRGNGNYIYLGDLNNNGIQDENEFDPAFYDADYVMVTIPTDELFPVIDLKTSLRTKFVFKEIINADGFISDILKVLSSETTVRIEENSRESDLKKIYLLNTSAFLNVNNTIRGNNFIQQDLFVFENDPELSFRFRFTQRNSLNQFSGGYERKYDREKSLRVRFKMVKEISNQTDIINTTNNLTAPSNKLRNSLVTGNEINSDFSYRPSQTIEVGFKFSVGRKEDKFPTTPTIIDINGQNIRVNYSLAGNGRIRFEVERIELNTSNSENYLPFEVTGGNQPGKNYFWRLNLDYRLASNLQSTVSYDGRIQGAGGKVIHSARAEVRAFF